jgi:hypothetical protein
MEQEDKKRNALYAIPCKLDEDDYEEMFFITFNTTNEKEASILASCITSSKKSLVIITDTGEYYDCS